MIIHNPILTGSFTVNGTDVASITSSAASITALNSYTASQNILNGTYTLTSSFAAQTASFTAFTSSVNTFTASQLVLNGTYATTGSNTFKNPQTINSNLTVTGSITAQTLIVSTINATQSYSSGSNIFGNASSNTQTFTGSLLISGSSYFSGSVNSTNLVASSTYSGDPVLASFTNASTGSAAEATIYIANSAATTTDAVFIQAIGINNPGTSGFVQDGGTIGTGAGLSGGLSLMVRADAAMRFYTNGHTNERMRITGSNVGIGTINPQATLHIVSPVVTAGTALKVVSDGNSNDKVFEFTGADGVATQTMVMLQSGNVGIGISSPTSKLHVYGQLSYNDGIYVSNPGLNGASITLSSTDTGGLPFTIISTASSNTPGAGTLSIYDGTAYRFTLKAGSVGIGTNNPARILHTYGTAATAEWILEDSAGSANVKKFNALVSTGVTQFRALNDANNGGTVWLTAANSTGYVNIGSATPTNIFQVGTTNYAGNEFAMGNGSTDFAIDLTSTAVDIFSSRGFRFLSSSGTYNLTMATTGYLVSIPTYNNTTSGTANMLILSDGQFCRNTSSQKYKRDIRNYDKGLTEVLQMQPKYYKGKSSLDGENQYAGFIAEEIDSLGLNEFVVYADDGSPDSLAYPNMAALLVKAIQELQAQITELKNK